MTNLHLVAIYAGVNIFLLLALALMVVGARRRTKVSLGTGDDESLLRATRVHGNAAEYIPAGLVGLSILGVMNPEAPQWAIHLCGGLLTAGRLLHAIGFSGNSGVSFGRAAGTMLTWTAFIATGGLLIAFGAGLTL